MVEIKINGDTLIDTIKALKNYQFELDHKVRFYENIPNDEDKFKRLIESARKQLEIVSDLLMVYEIGSRDKKKIFG